MGCWAKHYPRLSLHRSGLLFARYRAFPKSLRRDLERQRSPDGYGGWFYNDGGGTGVSGRSTSEAGGDGVKAESYSLTGRGLFARNYGGGIAIVAHDNSAAELFHMTPSLLLVQEAPTGDFIIGATGYGGNNRWRVNQTGRGLFNGGLQVSGADYAEQLPVQGEEADY